MSDMLTAIQEAYSDEEIKPIYGLDEAVIGIDEKSMTLIYSVKKVIEIFSTKMTVEEAVEHFEFNYANCHTDMSPIWCHDDFIS